MEIAAVPVGSTGHVSADSPAPGAAGGAWPVSRADENELRLLLSLRFRIRNDLGLAEDDYDRLLDEQRLRQTGGQ